MYLELWISIIILIFSFYILIKTADYLVATGGILGQRAGISKFVIGLTIIAIGTSLPELITAIMSIFTSQNNAPAFVLGTVIGSNIANTLLVFGILLIFAKKFKIKKRNKDLLFLLFSTLFLGLAIYSGFINIIFGIIFLILFISYIYLSIKFQNKKEIEEELNEVKDKKLENLKNFTLILIFLLSTLGLSLAAKGIIYSIESLGPLIGLSIQFLTLTTVAFATSLPEIIVTISSIKRKEFSLGIGNIIGSNISNILLIIGTSAIFGVLFNNELKFLTNDFQLSFILLLIITIIFTILIQKKYLKIIHGIFLIFLYFIYLFLIF